MDLQLVDTLANNNPKLLHSCWVMSEISKNVRDQVTINSWITRTARTTKQQSTLSIVLNTAALNGMIGGTISIGTYSNGNHLLLALY